MSWTEDHDLLLCREILNIDPFTGTKKGTIQRGNKWKEIVSNLMDIESPKFKVDCRAVRDRYNLLSQRLRKKLKDEQAASGIETDMSEIETALEEVIEKEDASEETQEGESESKRKAKEQEKGTAESMRKKAMETLGETKKRKSEDESNEVKTKRRSNGTDALVYLQERNESRKQEMELKQKEIELQEKRHEDMMKMLMASQNQQAKVMQDFQVLMLNMMARSGQK
jgi:hypothetical protein